MGAYPNSRAPSSCNVALNKSGYQPTPPKMGGQTGVLERATFWPVQSDQGSSATVDKHAA